MRQPFLLFIIMLILGCGTTPPKDNTDYKNIIGKSIKIHNLEIAQFDFPYKLDWISAKNACSNMGNGWRLPTVEEFDLLTRYNSKIENYVKGDYWTSYEYASGYSLEKELDCAETREIEKEKNESSRFNWPK